jgi:glycosyltransferase involved in cell wall biosynthesis
MKKDILISVYNMEIGGIERSLINMLDSFDYDHYNIDLLIFEHKGDLMDLIPKQVNILPQIGRYSIFRKSIYQCIKEGHFATSFMRIIGKYIANRKAKSKKLREGSAYIQMQLALLYSTPFLPKIKKYYDIAISYAWPHDILAKKVMAAKKIAWIHTDYSKLEIDNGIDFKIWNRFDHIGSVSVECTKSFLTQYPALKKKVFEMENINSPDFIRKMAKESVYENEGEIFRIVSVGRLSYAKGFDMAIQALRELHDKGYKKIKWFVVGYGPEYNNLQNLITQNKLTNYFILLGKQLNPYPFIDKADIYVQPSRYEGKAVTVTEAKILSKPVLITNYSTAKSQVKHDLDGYITECSVEGIVKGIEMLYKDALKRKHLIDNCRKADYSNGYELEKLYKTAHKH